MARVARSEAAQRVVVIGAGAIGLATALSLQAEGRAVTLVERQGPGEGASFGNASVLATESVVPVATPGLVWKVPGLLLDPLGPLALRWSYLPRLAPWLLRFVAASRASRVEAISLALAALLDGALEAYGPLLRRAGAEAMLVRRGWIGAYTGARGLAGAQASVALQRRRGVVVEALDVAAMRRMEPALSRDLAGGYYYPEVAHVIETYRLMRAFAAAFERDGGTLMKAEARDFRFGPKGVAAVLTEAGEIACEAVVVAAGAWSGPLARKLGAPVPLDTERGYHLTIPAPGIDLSRPVYANEFGIACTPLGGPLRLGGTVELGGLTAPPNWRRAELLATRARRLFPDLVSEGASRWMGFRPSMPDSLPVIGASPKVANAFLGFGHGHLGLTLAARSGALLADLVCGRAPTIDLAPYRPERF